MSGAPPHRRAGGLALLVGLAACNGPPSVVSEAPFPLRVDAGAVGLLAFGRTDGNGETSELFPLLIDTGTVRSSRSVPAARGQRVAQRRLSLLDGNGTLRAEFADVQILETQLARSGVGEQALPLAPLGGILGGDLLQRFSVDLDYPCRTPLLALLPAELACSCALAAGHPAQAVLPFQLAGGGTAQFDDELVIYPPTRVTLDACLEPNRDPLSRGEACVKSGKFNAAEYGLDGRPGTDVRLLVATGFPGLLLGAGAYDRLRPRRPFASLPRDVPLYFPGRAAPILAARASLDDPALAGHADRSAIALVERFGLLGACGELARSRRLRAFRRHPGMGRPPVCGGQTPSCRDTECPAGEPCSSDRDCPLDEKGKAQACGEPCLRCLPGLQCGDARGVNRCGDHDQPAAAYVEIDGQLPLYVVDDTSPILQEINFDIRPLLSDVEGIIGTELLRRLRTRIDYPRNRVLLRCASEGTGCRTFPRFICPGDAGDCGYNGQSRDTLCSSPAQIERLLPEAGLPADLGRVFDGGIPADQAPPADGGGAADQGSGSDRGCAP